MNMKTSYQTTATKLSVALVACAMLSACGGMGDRISNIGQEPSMTRIANPVTQPDYQPVSMPMPHPQEVRQEKNSLWSSNRQTFFKDQRATDVGDIITVMIDIRDEAELENSTRRTRSSSEDAGVSALLGYEKMLGKIMPHDFDSDNMAGFGSGSNYSGKGTIEREEQVKVKLAAIVTQILPNGNMVINGKQEVRVNFEKRILHIDGVIRPEDIEIDNSVSYDKIAEARIAYGGEGHVSDMQQPRYGQQLYDIVFPF